MAIRNIVQFGEDILKKECRPVEKFDHKLRQLLDDMQDTLYEASPVGEEGETPFTLYVPDGAVEPAQVLYLLDGQLTAAGETGVSRD